MIASRGLFRVDRALKLVNLYVKSEPVNYFQGHCPHHCLSFSKKMVGGKNNLGSMDVSKKRRTVKQIWMQIPSQATSTEEDIIKDVVVESERGYEDQEMCSIASSNSNREQVTEVTESVPISSTTMEEKVEDGTLEGELVLRAEKHVLSVEVAASLVRFIVGKGGCTLKKIEEELGVKISIPSPKKEEPVVIEGVSLDSVTKASHEIQAIIDEAVKSPSLDYSHFISLPLAIHPELVKKLVNFQNTILGNNGDSVDEEGGPVEDISDNEDKDQESNEAHSVDVRLQVEDENRVKVDLAPIPLLWNKERVNAASEVLKNISSKVMDTLDNNPVTVRLKGLDCMRGSLAKARVLYATVEEGGNDGRLTRACQVIIDEFVEAGLVLEKDAKHTLKLHATVMNARHGNGRGKKGRGKSNSFDARCIFEKFGSEYWGEYLIREAHLSQRFAYDENGYYHCCASIPFPESMQVD